MTRSSRWPLAGITPPRPPVQALGRTGEPRTEWFHLGEVRNELVGEQPPADDETDTRSSADVYIFGPIGGWSGVTADDFVRDVAGLDVDHINLHLNSPGGGAWEGVAIANVLRAHRADVTVWVDGIAASACSVIAMAGDEVVMGIGAQLMIHDASGSAWGDAETMRQAAAMLDSTSDAIAATYAAKAGGTAEEWRAVMVAESWYTGPEAVTAGLADRVATDEDRGTASGEQIVPGRSFSFWDLWDSLGDPERHADTLRALYEHAGRADAPPPPMPGRAPGSQSPAASADGSTPSQEGSRAVDFMDEQLTTMRQQLGLPEDANEATIQAALMERLAQPAAQPPTLTLPEGAVAIERTVLEDLRAQAADGRAAREQQRAEHRAQLVSAAVADGRIPPARREHWLTALQTDPEGAEASLAALAPGLIPVGPEIGHAANEGDVDIQVSDAALDQLAAAAGLPKGALRG